MLDIKQIEFNIILYHYNKFAYTPNAMMKFTPLIQDTECSICLDDIYSDSSVKCSTPHITTQCGHRFHTNCLHKWCMDNNSCPTCRCENVMDTNVKVYKSVASHNNGYAVRMNIFIHNINQIVRHKTPGRRVQAAALRRAQAADRRRHNIVVPETPSVLNQVNRHSPPPLPSDWVNQHLPTQSIQH